MYLEVYFSVQPYEIPAYGFLFPVMGGDVAEHNVNIRDQNLSWLSHKKFLAYYCLAATCYVAT